MRRFSTLAPKSTSDEFRTFKTAIDINKMEQTSPVKKKTRVLTGQLKLSRIASEKCEKILGSDSKVFEINELGDDSSPFKNEIVEFSRKTKLATNLLLP